MKHKLLVKALSSIMLVDPSTGDYVDNKRPYVVHNTHFIRHRAGQTTPPVAPQIEVFPIDLKDDATDAELAKFFKDSGNNEDLAMNSFLSVWSEGAPDNTEDAQKAAAQAQEEADKAKAQEEADKAKAAQEEADKAAAKAQEEADAKAQEEAAAKAKAEEEEAAAAAAKAQEEADKAGTADKAADKSTPRRRA